MKKTESRDGSNPKDLHAAQAAVHTMANTNNQCTVTMEGVLKKRGARMHRWSTRYVILSGSKLSYKVKRESTNLRGSFDLVSGCILTEIQEESQMKGKKLYSFWLVWPQDKSIEDGKSGEVVVVKEEESDDELEHREEPQVGAVPATAAKIPKDEANKAKDLKSIVQTEAMSAEIQRRKAEDQLQRHQTEDASLNLGVRVAAVTVGGVVVGALTAGIGLVPYMAVVGIVAAASGGAVAFQYRRPSDSRLILASDDLEYISMWRAAIEEEIIKVEMHGKPLLPANADVNVISHILGISGAGGLGGWTRVGIIEGMRIMEQKEAVDGYSCRKAQLVVKCSPTNAFMVIMDVGHLQYPRNGSVKVANHVDDHVDILEVNCLQPRSRNDPLYKPKSGMFSSFDLFADTNTELLDHHGSGSCSRHYQSSSCADGQSVRVTGFLSRFWRLDDDGSYIIILTTTAGGDPAGDAQNLAPDTVALPQLTAVCTVSPRRDYEQFDDDVPFALITCTIQVQEVTGMWTDKQFLGDFLTDYLSSLLEVRQAINIAKYDTAAQSNCLSPDHSEHALTYWLGPSPVGTSNVLTPRDDSNSTPEYGRGRKTLERQGSARLDGVATVQPGLDEGSSRAGRVNLKSHSGSDGEGKPGDARNLQTPALAKKKDRTRKEKAEASNLRNVIATKEYELQRTEKLIQKKGSLGAAQKLAGQGGTSSPYSAAGSAQELMHVLNSLQCDIKELKDSYHKLTGVSYESSSRRRFLSRMRGKDRTRENSATRAGNTTREQDRHERFEAAYAAAAVTSDSPVSPLVARGMSREKQILEARNQLTASFCELDNLHAAEDRPYPRMWRYALMKETVSSMDIRTVFMRGCSRQNLIIIGVYIFATCVSILVERRSTLVCGYIDEWLVPFGYSSELLADIAEAAVEGGALAIRHGGGVTKRMMLNILRRIISASKAFVDQLMAPT